MDTKEFTRQDYMDGKCTHSEYYAQWATGYIHSLVKSSIGEEAIKNSQDEHFNDIPLQVWDKLAQFVSYFPDNSLATRVCILKEAARQIRGI